MKLQLSHPSGLHELCLSRLDEYLCGDTQSLLEDRDACKKSASK